MLSEKPWKPEAVLRLLLGVFVCLCFSSLVLQLLLPRDALDTAPGKFFSLLVSTIGFHWMGLLLVAFFLRGHAIGWGEAFGLNSSNTVKAILLGTAGALVILPVAWTLVHWSAEAIMFFSDKAPARQLAVQAVEAAASPDQQVYAIFSTLLLAPAVEEILFRGILYPSVKQLGFPRTALWGTSLMFALVHSSLMIFIPLTVLSLLLAWLYERTGNLLAPVVTHSLFNAANYIWLTHPREARALFQSWQ